MLYLGESPLELTRHVFDLFHQLTYEHILPDSRSQFLPTVDAQGIQYITNRKTDNSRLIQDVVDHQKVFNNLRTECH